MRNKIKIFLLSSIMLTAISFTQNAFAASCDPEIAKKMSDGLIEQINKTDKWTGQPFKPSENSGDNSLFGCTNMWPTADFGFKLPDIADIIEKIGQEAMNKACNAARSAINEQVSKAQSSISLDTSSIEGFSELGIGNINLGSANVSTGTGNSPSSGWDNITSNFK